MMKRFITYMCIETYKKSYIWSPGWYPVVVFHGTGYSVRD